MEEKEERIRQLQEEQEAWERVKTAGYEEKNPHNKKDCAKRNLRA